MAEPNAEHPVSEVHYFERLIHCCYEVPFWEFNGAMELQTPVTPENELLLYFFRFSDAAKRLSAYMETRNSMPVFISNSVRLMWVAAFRYEDSSCREIVLMGPISINEQTPQQIRNMIGGSEQPLDIRRRVTSALNHIPIIPSNSLFQYTMMLHYALTGERISVSDIQHEEQRKARQAYSSAMQKVRDVLSDPDSPEAAQDAAHQGVLPLDMQLLEIVRTGNLDYGDIFSKAALVSKGIRTHRDDAMRGYKNSIIQFIGLCSRAAIQGGLPAPLSYTLSDTYTDLVEGCSSIAELTELNHTMFADYVRRVHLYRQQGESALSRPVRTVCDYIGMHTEGDLSLEHLAKIAGYTPYYLSRKFTQETGTSPADYINKIKIERAKLMLRTSNTSIQDIADELRFTSRSYFTTVFRKYAGCSPSEYREQKA